MALASSGLREYSTMRAAHIARSGLSKCVAAALLAGCGASQKISPPVEQLTILTPAHRHTGGYSSLYSFKGGTDGSDPVAGLLALKGTLYGTTWNGGANNGTVFAITRSGVETILYRFKGGKDGSNPAAGLINVNGTLYGTTSAGGTGNNGTVFAITTSGKERILHRFGSSGDGAEPYAGLLDVNGTIYGTTRSGGVNGVGTVFAVTTAGKETVLHSFGDSGDGVNPFAALINVKGTLYGTTSGGGAYSCGSHVGCGTVFSITTGGTEKVLYSFSAPGMGDGYYPTAALIDVKGTLYGTTVYGGVEGCGSNNCGTVFSITTGGAEKVLHSFGEGWDGGEPHAGLIDVRGTLYGTTFQGGTSGGCGGYGCGTVFSITSGGREKVLQSFGEGSADGVSPYAALVDASGTLYGTASGGGASNDGTVFRILP
jgi:uncharacterized repeat protein (TIGR03803 family)